MAGDLLLGGFESEAGGRASFSLSSEARLANPNGNKGKLEAQPTKND